MSTPVQLESEKRRGSAIMLAVEIDSTFKLYSYHILDHEQYISRINELVDFYRYNLSKSEIKKAAKASGFPAKLEKV